MPLPFISSPRISRARTTFALQLTLHWTPRANANDAINAKNKENVEQFKEEERAAYEKAYVEAVKDRVTAISKLRTRNRDELREEERIVVYRKLIQEMLLNGIDLPDDRTRHVTAELLNSIFDIDKMLYFVAPEWWRPRLHRSRQQLQASPGPKTGQADFGATAEEAIIRVLWPGASSRPHRSFHLTSSLAARWAGAA